VKGLIAAPRCRWQDKIQLEFYELGYECVEWINLAHGKTTGKLLYAWK
jgi:hypothetical protein